MNDGFRAQYARRSESGQVLWWRRIDSGRRVVSIDITQHNQIPLDFESQHRHRGIGWSYRETSMAMVSSRNTLLGLPPIVVAIGGRNDRFSERTGNIQVTNAVKHACRKIHKEHKNGDQSAKFPQTSSAYGSCLDQCSISDQRPALVYTAGDTMSMSNSVTSPDIPF